MLLGMSEPDVVYAQVEEPKVVLIETVWTEEDIKKEIDEQAKRYGVSAYEMHTTISCESNYNRYALGDKGKSRGLVQIHSDYHDVSDEDAYNPRFAIEFLAKNLSQGNGKLWTCWRQNFAK
jgi:soluble lytic murein transglycosylase-like protein